MYLKFMNANLEAFSPEYHDQIWGSTYDLAFDVQPTIYMYYDESVHIHRMAWYLSVPE